MKYIKLFENWYGDRDKQYNLNIDYSKFLIDFDYTFDIVKQINPTFKSERDEMYDGYTSEWYMSCEDIFDENGVGENDDFNSDKTQKVIMLCKEKFAKYELKEYMNFYQKYKNSKIPVKRVINVDSVSTINWDSLGVYWTFDNKHGRSFSNKNKTVIEFLGNVDSKYVNWLNSLDNYIFFGESENEVKITKGSPIFIKEYNVNTYDGGYKNNMVKVNSIKHC